MKKIILLFLCLTIFNACSSSITSDSQISDEESAKRLEELKLKVAELENQVDKNPEEKKVEVAEVAKVVETEVKKEPVVSFDSKFTNGVTFTAEPVILTGTLSPNATKIEVTATGINYKDVYQLMNFKKGDTTFIYRSSIAWGNLAVGKNNYEVTATFEDGTKATTTIEINFKSLFRISILDQF